MSKELEELRARVDELNMQILNLINERGRLVKEIGRIKGQQGVNRYDPVRERKMLDKILENNDGPFEKSTLQHLFKEIFKASLELQEDDHRKALLVSRKKHPDDTVIDIKEQKSETENPSLFWSLCRGIVRTSGCGGRGCQSERVDFASGRSI